MCESLSPLLQQYIIEVCCTLCSVFLLNFLNFLFQNENPNEVLQLTSLIAEGAFGMVYRVF